MKFRSDKKENSAGIVSGTLPDAEAAVQSTRKDEKPVKFRIKNHNMTRSRWAFAAIFAGITFVLYLVFCVYPILQSVYQSFLDWNGYRAYIPHFIGLDNYVNVTQDPIFWRAMANDLVITLIKEVVIILLTVIFALALTRLKLRKWENAFYKFVFYIPNVLSVIIIGTVWRFIFMSGTGGLLNSLIGIFSPGYGKDWITDTPLGVIGFTASWCGVGLFMLTMIASINQVSDELYEAAKVDGAGEMKQLWYITMPAVWLQITFIVVTILYQSLGGNLAIVNVFAPLGGVNGNAMVMGLYVYLYGQANYSTVTGPVSYSYAAAVLMLIITAVISLGVKYIMGKVGERI